MWLWVREGGGSTAGSGPSEVSQGQNPPALALCSIQHGLKLPAMGPAVHIMQPLTQSTSASVCVFVVRMFVYLAVVKHCVDELLTIACSGCNYED